MVDDLLAGALGQAERSKPPVRAAALLRIARGMMPFDRELARNVQERGLAEIRWLSVHRPCHRIRVALLLLATLSCQLACHISGVLIDSSRDGGVWWFPQSTGFDSNAPHQGKAVADYLRQRKLVVTELPRPFAITSSLLQKFRVVIRAGQFGAYSSAELEAYRRYVSQGGRLILLSEFHRPGETDPLAQTFGLDFRGTSRGENVMNRFTKHPITSGLSPIEYRVGSGLFAVPPSATILGYLSESTFIDLNDNGEIDPGEPIGAPVMGVMRFGKGQIFFLGDTNTMELVPQPLIDNLLRFH
jgi:hypothetical protein